MVFWRYLWWGLAALLLILTLLPMARSDHWWIRIWDFPRAQIAVAILFTIAIGFASLAWQMPVNTALLGALAIAFAYQVWKILPYTPLAAQTVITAPDAPLDRQISLVSANVLMDNRNAEKLFKIISDADPDLVLLIETDSWWDANTKKLRNEYKHSIRQPQSNTYGMHLFSRFELIEPELRFLIEDDVPSIRTGVRLPSGQVIEFYGVHPRPPKPGTDTTERDAELLLVGREVTQRRNPAIVAGDLNDVAWSATTDLFQRISGMLDPRVGRGTFSTFPADYPPLRWALDHVFHERSFALSKMQLLPAFGSDHLPIYVRLAYLPIEAPPEQPAPKADHVDKNEARKKIIKGKNATDSK